MCMGGCLLDTRITDKIDTYTEHFAINYSNEILDFAENIFPDYIFVRREKKQQYGYCTHCRKEFPTSGLVHKKTTKCPGCKEDVIIQSVGMSRSYMVNEAYFIYYDKSVIDPNVIVARGICAVEDYTGSDYRTVKPEMMDRTLYVFKLGEPVMLKRYAYYTSNK